ncbi:putative lipid-transfer protein DIR1 [Senna tora]|uniref:Putative lipid-transfer protein DIR1 n=1 Tax=Senna tora TaxID=362788 RepID=A0A834T5M8_9FABA|nr:putative lipid-transfer protein DIR1 [Senna tora]
MAHTIGKALVLWLLAAILVIGLWGGAEGVLLCNIESSKLNLCRAAITGEKPPWPTPKCCAVIGRADLSCLCKYKSLLPSVGINPANALALPGKCGLKLPRGC